MELINYFLLLIVLIANAKAALCPKECDCDTSNGLNRAICMDQNIISIEVGVPNGVQIYSLARNVISELDNFCFKEAGYTSLQVLDLSYNVIFWIGLHAFSGLNELTQVILSNNRLRNIPYDLFTDNRQLTTLDLSSNIFESLKNEPLLMHLKIQILNLNNCRIKSLPDRIFTRLPNLKKLDLSENYIVTLNSRVLRPLRKLERIELRNDYWKCNAEFKDVESWLISRGVTYQKQCRENRPKMSEKMISIVQAEKEDVDVNDVWNITTPDVTTPKIEKKVLSRFEKFDKEFSAVQAFVIGLELGLAFGVVGTYVWLRKLCCFGRLNFSRPLTRRQIRRNQRIRDGDMRTNLLWSNVITPDGDSPPSYRRQISSSEPSAPYPTYGIPAVRESALQVDAIRMPDRAETPPPPYHECPTNI